MFALHAHRGARFAKRAYVRFQAQNLPARTSAKGRKGESRLSVSGRPDSSAQTLFLVVQEERQQCEVQLTPKVHALKGGNGRIAVPVTKASRVGFGMSDLPFESPSFPCLE